VEFLNSFEDDFERTRTMRRQRLALTALIAAVAVLAFAMPADAEKILRRGNAAEPYSLDPQRATGIPENNIIGDMIIGLYTEGADSNTILGAAESAQTSEDGLTWTFKIRDHLWSDGTPVTSNDFVFALRREIIRSRTRRR